MGCGSTFPTSTKHLRSTRSSPHCEQTRHAGWKYSLPPRNRSTDTTVSPTLSMCEHVKHRPTIIAYVSDVSTPSTQTMLLDLRTSRLLILRRLFLGHCWQRHLRTVSTPTNQINSSRFDINCDVRLILRVGVELVQAEQ